MSAAEIALDVTDWRRAVFALYSDVRQGSLTDPAGAHARWRERRNDLFATHPASPLPPSGRRAFTGLPVADYDPAWRFELPIVTDSEAVPHRIDIVTGGADGVVSLERIGRVGVSSAGWLDVWRLVSYGGGLFVPVKDALAGHPSGTYGGGRYVLDTIKGADLGAGRYAGTVVLDFNFAYNPSCAYDPAWACPLAPPGNVLLVDVPVGERSPSA